MGSGAGLFLWLESCLHIQTKTVSVFSQTVVLMKQANKRQCSPLVLRDINERGRDLESILAQYITFVKPAFEEFCLPVSALLNAFSSTQFTRMSPWIIDLLSNLLLFLWMLFRQRSMQMSSYQEEQKTLVSVVCFHLAGSWRKWGILTINVSETLRHQSKRVLSWRTHLCLLLTSRLGIVLSNSR